MTRPFFSLIRAYFPVHEAENEGPVTAKAGVVLQRLTLQGNWHAIYMATHTHTDIPHTRKQTRCVRQAASITGGEGAQNSQKQTHTCTHVHMYTHSRQQRAYSVWWQDELPLLYYQGDSSDSNQWKQDESPYQRRKMQTWRETQNKKMRSLAGILSCT